MGGGGGGRGVRFTVREHEVVIRDEGAKVLKGLLDSGYKEWACCLKSALHVDKEVRLEAVHPLPKKKGQKHMGKGEKDY